MKSVQLEAHGPKAPIDDMELHNTVNANSTICRWRECTKGLNLQGHCQNEECIAHKECVIDPIGIGSFSLKADKVTS
jgi:hypothetical protein